VRIWQLALAPILGETRAAGVTQQAENRLQSLRGSQSHVVTPALERQLYETLLPLLALYQALTMAIGDEVGALEATEACLHAEYAQRIRLMPVFSHLPGSFSLLKRIIRRMVRTSFPAEGWEAQIVSDTRDRFEFTMHRCFYHETLQRYGASALTPILCKTDDWLGEALAPAIRWERTRTLGRGDEYCDFCYRRGP
jgi:hypothetical protein